MVGGRYKTLRKRLKRMSKLEIQATRNWFILIILLVVNLGQTKLRIDGFIFFPLPTKVRECLYKKSRVGYWFINK